MVRYTVVNSKAENSGYLSEDNGGFNHQQNHSDQQGGNSQHQGEHQENKERRNYTTIAGNNSEDKSTEQRLEELMRKMRVRSGAVDYKI